MAEKITSIMATEVALDVTPANRSLRALKDSVNIVNKAVKAHAANLQAAGSQYDAAKAKAEGLSNVIDRQRDVVSRLEQQQARQVEVAKDQANTISDLQNKIKQATQARKDEAAENGRDTDTYEKLTEKIKGYRSALVEANNIDSRLRSTTNQLENARGKLASLRMQQQRASEQMRELSPSGWNRIATAVVNANGKIQETRDRVGGLRGAFAGTFAGTALVNGFSTALNTVKTGITGIVKAGSDFDKKQQVMQASWDTLMGSASKADSMRQSIVNMSNALGQPVELTDELSQQFYHVFDNQPETEQLTRSFLTMGDAIGLSSDRLKQVGMDFTHMLSSSTLQLGDLNQISDAFPMFSSALLDYERQLQHNGSLTMSDLRKQISAGKIQSKDAEAVMNQLGEKYKQSSENLMNTLPGMARQIRSKVSQLSGDVMDPILKQQSPVYKMVSNWVADPNTDAEFKQLGQKVNQSIQTVLNAFSGGGNKFTVINGLNNAVQQTGNIVQTVANWIARNAQTIRASFNLIGAAGKAGFAILGAAIRAVVAALNLFTGGAQKSGKQSQSTAQQLNQLANNLNRLASNRSRVQMLGRALAGIFIATKIVRFTSFIRGLSSTIAGPLVGAVSRGITAFRAGASAIGVMNAALAINPYVLAAAAIAGITVALVVLYRHNKKFRDFMRGLWVITKTVAGAIIKSFPAYWMIKALQKLYQQSPAFRRFVNNMAHVVRTIFGTLFKWLKDMLGGIWKGIKWAYNKVANIGRSGSISNPSHYYASGTGSIDEDQIAVVNDSNSANGRWREMMLYNGKLSLFPNQRNLRAYVPKGAQILNGDDAAKLMSRSVNHFASGTADFSSWVSNLNAAGAIAHAEERKKFMAELRKQFDQYMKEITKSLNDLSARLAEASQKRDDSIMQARRTLNQSLLEAYRKMAGGTAKDKSEGEKEKINAYNRYRSAVNKANSTYQKAADNIQQKRNIAYLNRSRLNRWYHENIRQADRDFAEYANGGIASTASVFGEAGPEMAIPMDSMKEDRAWTLMGQLVDFYGGNRNGNQQVSQQGSADHAQLLELNAKFDKLLNFAAQLVNGQGAQIDATKKVQGYNANTAFDDFSSKLRNAQSSGLTY
ncbi:tape measure protein [Limosilactobacillus reuteri]